MVPRFSKQKDTPTEVYLDCVRFLSYEAALLDADQLSEWFDLLHEDISYRVPVRTNREGGAEQFSDQAFHLKEDWTSLKARIDRLESDYAWSEDPPPRTRRFVTNVRIVDSTDEEIQLRNNLLLYRSQGDTSANDFISAERHDRIQFDADEWKLAERTVLLDHTVLGVDEIAMFL